MKTCKLCEKEPAGSEEHIVLKSMGGRKVVRGFLCEPCNNRLGNAIDAPLEEVFRPISLMTGCVRGDGKGVRPMELEFADGKRRKLVPGGLVDVRRPITVNVADERVGGIRIFDPFVVAKIAEQKLRDLMSEGDRVQVKMSVVPELEPEETIFEFNFGDLAHYRSVLKMGLALIASENRLVDGPELHRCLEFINGASEEWHRNIDHAADSELRSEFSTHPRQHVLAAVPEGDQWELVFLVFGYIPIRMKLPAPKGGMSSAAHVVDPIAGTHEVRRGFRHEERGRIQEFKPTVEDANTLVGRFRAWVDWQHQRARAQALGMRRMETAVADLFDQWSGQRTKYMETEKQVRQLAEAVVAALQDEHAPRSKYPDAGLVQEELNKLFSADRQGDGE